MGHRVISNATTRLEAEHESGREDGEKQEKTDTFFAHYEKYFEKHCENRNSFDDKVLLKIDIEGNEYEVFSKMDIEKLSGIAAGLVIEFHDLNSTTQRALFFDCLARINKYFYLTHLHGNNFFGNFDFFEKRFHRMRLF